MQLILFSKKRSHEEFVKGVLREKGSGVFSAVESPSYSLMEKKGIEIDIMTKEL